MPGLNGLETAARAQKESPRTRVLLLSMHKDEEYVRRALLSGAAGYLLKDAEADEVGAAVRAAKHGQVHLDPAVARKLTRSLVAPQRTATALTPREREILILVAHGKSNRDIADTLVISERTARTHVSNVLAKLGLASRTQAALWAIREGLVTRP